MHCTTLKGVYPSLILRLIADVEKQPGFDCLHMPEKPHGSHGSCFYVYSPDSFSAICTAHSRLPSVRPRTFKARTDTSSHTSVVICI